MSPSTARAPVGLSIIGWLAIISGVFQFLAGLLFLFAKDDIQESASAYSSDELTAIGIASIVFGLIYIFVGRGFLRLSGFALALGLFFSGLGTIGGAVVILTNGLGDLHYSVVLSFLINLVVLLACWSGFRARAS